MEQIINTVIITQARVSSTRLPNKVLLKINNQQLLEIHLKRLSKCQLVDKIIVATTTNPKDLEIEKLSKTLGFDVFRGSENDVLDRFYQACKDLKPKWVVRVTSDCPLIDPILIDSLIREAHVKEVDYCANILVENYPDGQDIEVFKFTALEKAWREAMLNSEREHVTPYIRNNSDFKGGAIFTAENFPCFKDFSKIRMTVDEQCDFKLIEKLVTTIGTEKSWLEYTNYIIENDLSSINNIIRNEGYLKSIKED